MKNLLLKPWFTASVITLITGVIVLIVLWIWKPVDIQSFKDNLLSGIVMMFFDVVIVVFLFSMINTITEKKQRIKRYEEEIDDYRPWQDEEAIWRLRGLIKRMNKAGQTKLRLWGANLAKADLGKANLTGASLSEANLAEADLINANLDGADLQWVNFEGAYLTEATLRNANLYKANLTDAFLVRVKFNGAKLELADLSWANLEGAEILLSQLKNLKSLEGATMMDGTKYDESWAKRISETEEPKAKEESK
jgi:hypothetical protein